MSPASCGDNPLRDAGEHLDTGTCLCHHRCTDEDHPERFCKSFHPPAALRGSLPAVQRRCARPAWKWGQEVAPEGRQPSPPQAPSRRRVANTPPSKFLSASYNPFFPISLYMVVTPRRVSRVRRAQPGPLPFGRGQQKSPPSRWEHPETPRCARRYRP